MQFLGMSESSVFYSGLIIMFLVCVLVQLYYYFFSFSKLAFYKEKVSPEYSKPVSIIIAAKNEAESLKKYLPKVLNQYYPLYEVIVVNNNSTDDTLTVLQNITDPKLEIINCEEEGKKAALKKGVEKAQFENLVFIDADCVPSSDFWLYTLAGKFSLKKHIVLGFGGFFKENTLINKVIRFEGLLNATQYFSYALKGKAYMGVGRNLAYTKAVLNNTAGYHHNKTLSGDDDLIVNQMATTTNVEVCITENAHTYTKGESSWKSLFHQKRRQLVAGNYYKKSQKIELAIFGATNFLFYFLFFILLFKLGLNLWLIGIFVVKQFVEYRLYNDVCKNLKNKDISLLLPILEPIYLVFITLVGVSTWFWKVEKWK